MKRWFWRWRGGVSAGCRLLVCIGRCAEERSARLSRFCWTSAAVLSDRIIPISRSFTWHGSRQSPVAAIADAAQRACRWSSGILSRSDEPEPDEMMRLAGDMGLYRGDGLGRDALRLLLAEYGVDGALARAGCAGDREYAAQGAGRSSSTWGAGYFTGKRALCRFARHCGRRGCCSSPIRTARKRRLHKTYRFAEIAQAGERQIIRS